MDSGIYVFLDELSRKLLEELQKDARIGFAELARRVGLSPSATAERVRRLEDEGIIRGYRVDIDPRALGYSIMVFTRMSFQGERYKHFLTYIKGIEAVRECFHTTGADALIMKILARSIEELDSIVTKFLAYGEPNSSVVLGDAIVRRRYSLDPVKTKKSFEREPNSVRLG
jgi:Lrp/AsnC family transcriptional regulator, leucine-responsive regulatory protein